ncbi:MAG TPA: sel1 repeat family protein [Nitrospinaceae bacterium]|nr:sel1 repeat family protein [Nitrospinaceae bacterium]
MRYSHHMNKQLTFLLSLTLLFLVGCQTVGVNDNQSKDYTEEVRLHRLSAEQGNVKGQINLGVMYDKGQGVSQDYVLAHMWFSLASTKGIKKAIEKRNSAESKMSPTQITKAQEMVRNWKPTKK